LRSSVKDDTITVEFYGTGIDIIGYKSWSRGQAEVTLDESGAAVVTLVETFDASYDMHYQYPVYSVSGLTPGNHTLKIRVTGERDFLASGNAIDVDAFVVHK
ncbi:MAG TPA: hypothetical protein DEQ02_01535, partial [Ruminococcaceae bacterium]|nr:hypothetical protein [Oscillospiraceae bacterium]